MKDKSVWTWPRVLTGTSLLNCLFASALHFKWTLSPTMESHRETEHSSCQPVSQLITRCWGKWDGRVRTTIGDTNTKQLGQEWCCLGKWWWSKIYKETINTTETFGNVPFSVMMTSVWELPYLWMWSTASFMVSTTSMQHSRSPYSVRIDLASEGLNVR